MISKERIIPWLILAVTLLVGGYCFLQSSVRLQRIQILNARYSSVQDLGGVQVEYFDQIASGGSEGRQSLPLLPPLIKEVFGIDGFRLKQSPPQRLTDKIMLKEGTIDIVNADPDSVDEFLRTRNGNLGGWVLVGLNLDAVGRSGRISGQIKLAGLEAGGEN